MSNNVKQWGIVKWEGRPLATRKVLLSCPCCGNDAELDVGETPGALIIAAIGLNLVFDPPGYSPPSNFLADNTLL